MSQTPPVTPGTDEDDENYRGLSAYDSLNKGSVTSTESSLGEEGLTTSRVNRAATDDSGPDADESVEHRASRSDAANTSELDYDRDARESRDAREDAGHGAGADAGRPPLRNGDTGYAG